MDLKIKFLWFFIFTGTFVFSQEKWITKTGTVVFDSSMPAFEEVKATNKKAICAINTTTNEIASVMAIKDFQFKLSLMQEHFNENYMESDQFPKATFLGKTSNFDFKNLSDNKLEKINCVGNIIIRGKAKEIKIVLEILKTNKKVNLKSNFDLNTDDFNIELPYLVRNKLSKKVVVQLNYDFNLN